MTKSEFAQVTQLIVEQGEEARRLMETMVDRIIVEIQMAAKRLGLPDAS